MNNFVNGHVDYYHHFVHDHYASYDYLDHDHLVHDRGGSYYYHDDGDDDDVYQKTEIELASKHLLNITLIHSIPVGQVCSNKIQSPLQINAED